MLWSSTACHWPHLVTCIVHRYWIVTFEHTAVTTRVCVCWFTAWQHLNLVSQAYVRSHIGIDEWMHGTVLSLNRYFVATRTCIHRIEGIIAHQPGGLVYGSGLTSKSPDEQCRRTNLIAKPHASKSRYHLVTSYQRVRVIIDSCLIKINSTDNKV